MRRTSDPIHLIRTANPVPDPDRMPDGPETLMEEILGMTSTQPQRRKRRRRVPILVLALVGTVIGTAAAASLFINPGETTRIACGGENIISARSGDPVADCAAELDRLGIEHGELIAYANGNGGVTVVDGETPGLTPLGDDFRQDLAVIRLSEMLNDHVDGLDSGCYNAADAVNLARSSMKVLGLDWPVTTREATSGDTRCAVGFVVEDEHRVIIAMDVGPSPDEYAAAEEPPYTPFIDQLAQVVSDDCLSLDEAVPMADQLAIDNGVGYMTELSVVEDSTIDCSTVSVEVGGAVFVVLRGPANGPIPASVLPTPLPTDG